MITFFLRSVLGNWQVWVLLILLGLGGYGYYRYHRLETQLVKANQTLKVEQENNQTLRNNNKTLEATNKQNSTVIVQLNEDKNQLTQSLTRLNEDLMIAQNRVATVKTKIQLVTAPPQKLSPHIAAVIDGIQDQQPPNPAVKKGVTQ